VQCGAGHMVLAHLSTEKSDRTAFVMCICTNVSTAADSCTKTCMHETVSSDSREARS